VLIALKAFAMSRHEWIDLLIDWANSCRGRSESLDVATSTGSRDSNQL